MTSLFQQETFDCRVIFAQTLIELARQNDKIVVVCNDSVGSSNLNEFKKEFPDRLINVGIAEQNMIGVAAGLANGGFIPFVSCAGPFLSGRALEQVKADVAYNMYPIILCAQSPGVSYGELGPTHHSIEDFSWIRALTDITLLSPADPKQTKDALHWAVKANKPVYMRINRFKIPQTTPTEINFEVGKALLLREGQDVTLITTGILVPRALEAANSLEKEGISARVLNMHTLNPIDKEAIIAAASETNAIVTMEEAMTTGGLGAAVAEIVVENYPIKMRILGISQFAPTGTVSFLLDHFGLSVENIHKVALELVR